MSLLFPQLEVSQQQHQVHPDVEHPMITLLKLSLLYTDSYFFFCLMLFNPSMIRGLGMPFGIAASLEW